MRVLEAKPALFAVDASGTGRAVMVNQNGTLNDAGNPARLGEVLVAYLSGGGALDVMGPAGTVAAGVNRLRLPVSVTVGGVAAEVLYAGSAPGLIEGVTQINFRPAGRRA